MRMDESFEQEITILTKLTLLVILCIAQSIDPINVIEEVSSQVKLRGVASIELTTVPLLNNPIFSASQYYSSSREWEQCFDPFFDLIAVPLQCLGLLSSIL